MDIHILDSRKNAKHQFYFINMPEVILSLASLFKFIFQFKTYLSPARQKILTLKKKKKKKILTFILLHMSFSNLSVSPWFKYPKSKDLNPLGPGSNLFLLTHFLQFLLTHFPQFLQE